jgi:hypothetical protein
MTGFSASALPPAIEAATHLQTPWYDWVSQYCRLIENQLPPLLILNKPIT